MLVFTINRIIQSIIVIFLTSIVIFAGIFAIGNPVDLLMDSRATFEEMEQIKANLGLDKPFWEQYYIFLKSAAHPAVHPLSADGAEQTFGCLARRTTRLMTMPRRLLGHFSAGRDGINASVLTRPTL